MANGVILPPAGLTENVPHNGPLSPQEPLNRILLPSGYHAMPETPLASGVSFIGPVPSAFMIQRSGYWSCGKFARER